MKTKLTQAQIAEFAFNAGKDQDTFPAGMPQEILDLYSPDFDTITIWEENYASGANYASHAAAETCDASDRWLHEEDYLEWRDCMEG